MYAATTTCAASGVACIAVRVEARTTNGIPRLDIVGLPDAAVREGAQRVRSALKATVDWRASLRSLVNLSPASRRKAGSGFDLAVAMALLAAEEHCEAAALQSCVFLGELGLDGSLRPVAGSLPAAVTAAAEGKQRMIVARENACEAALAAGPTVWGVSTLAEALELVRSKWQSLAPTKMNARELLNRRASQTGLDLQDLRGLAGPKRVLEIAAAGEHHILLAGPPGSGKTMLARRLPGILPSPSLEEALEATAVHSIAGLITEQQPLLIERPFRAPHHTTSGAGLVGGGSVPSPGEISLAHRGVLFLDELPEFSPKVLNQLREPLEDRRLTISRAQGKECFPADFVLVAAMNPCPCGYAGSPRRHCTCSATTVERYCARISGPLIDRIDLFIDVPHIPYEELTSKPQGETTMAVRLRVAEARARRNRAAPRRGWHQPLQTGPSALLAAACDRLCLSSRSLHRCAAVGQTIAALAGRDEIEESDIAEALQYRPSTDTPQESY